MRTAIQEKLFQNQDEKYRAFNAALIPTVDKNKIIGVRTPILRKLAKSLRGTEEAKKFLAELPHRYYEENSLHAFLIEGIGNFDECLAETERFLPYVDNWATCDSMSPRIFSSNLIRTEAVAAKWLCSSHTYTVRYGINIYMKYFLDSEFRLEHLARIAKIKTHEYYVKMGIAWYFATALAKQYDTAVTYIENRVLDEWIHKKTIQKATESFRISSEQKEYLKKFR